MFDPHPRSSYYYYSIDVTILLLSVYTTGDDSCLLRMRISFSCTNGYGGTISSDSTELACLSFVRGTMSSDSKIGGLPCLIELSQ